VLPRMRRPRHLDRLGGVTVRIEIDITRTNAMCPTWQEDLRLALERAFGVGVDLSVNYSLEPVDTVVRLPDGGREALVRKIIEETNDTHWRILDGGDPDRPKTSMRPW